MALKTASREVRLQWFARRLLDAAWHGGVDGGDVQAWAEEAGLIVPQIATEQDIENHCLENIEPGDLFYRFSDDLNAANVDWTQLGDRPTPQSQAGG